MTRLKKFLRKRNDAAGTSSGRSTIQNDSPRSQSSRQTNAFVNASTARRRTSTRSLTSPVVVRYEPQVSKGATWKHRLRGLKMSLPSVRQRGRKDRDAEIDEVLQMNENFTFEDFQPEDEHRTSLGRQKHCSIGSTQHLMGSELHQQLPRHKSPQSIDPLAALPTDFLPQLSASNNIPAQPPSPSSYGFSSQPPTPTSSEFRPEPKASGHVRVSSLHDHYVLHEMLGEGSYATVFRAVAIQDENHHVAVKRFELDNVANKERREKLQRVIRNEADLLNRVREFHKGHAPNIVELFGIHHEPGTNNICLAMEFMKGGELHDRINSNTRFSESEAHRVFQDIANGVAQMHACGVVHRDLKPENIIYEHCGTQSKVKIADFGAAYIEGEEDSDVHNGIRIGSPGYFAPEVYRMKYSSAGDIWSLGVILFCLLSGTHPFPGETDVEVMMKVMMANYNFDGPAWSNVSDAAKTLISSMLQRTPAARLTIQQVLDDDWVRCNASNVLLAHLASEAECENEPCIASDVLPDGVTTEEQCIVTGDEVLNSNGAAILCNDSPVADASHGKNDSTQVSPKSMRAVNGVKNTRVSKLNLTINTSQLPAEHGETSRTDTAWRNWRLNRFNSSSTSLSSTSAPMSPGSAPVSPRFRRDAAVDGPAGTEDLSEDEQSPVRSNGTRNITSALKWASTSLKKVAPKTPSRR